MGSMLVGVKSHLGPPEVVSFTSSTIPAGKRPSNTARRPIGVGFPPASLAAREAPTGRAWGYRSPPLVRPRPRDEDRDASFARSTPQFSLGGSLARGLSCCARGRSAGSNSSGPRACVWHEARRRCGRVDATTDRREPQPTWATAAGDGRPYMTRISFCGLLNRMRAPSRVGPGRHDAAPGEERHA